MTPWDAFVLRHRHPVNLAFHFVSCACFWAGLVLPFVMRSPWYVAPTLLSGLIGAAGHAVSKESDVDLREMTSRPMVVVFSTRMILKILRGSYRADVERAVARAQGQGLDV